MNEDRAVSELRGVKRAVPRHRKPMLPKRILGYCDRVGTAVRVLKEPIECRSFNSLKQRFISMTANDRPRAWQHTIRHHG